MYYRVSNSGTGTINITTNGTHNVKKYASANVNVRPSITNVSRNISSITEGVAQKTFTLNVGAGYDAVYVNSMTTYNYQEGNSRNFSFSYNKSNGNVSITFNVGNKSFVSFQATIVFACFKY